MCPFEITTDGKLVSRALLSLPDLLEDEPRTDPEFNARGYLEGSARVSTLKCFSMVLLSMVVL